jgi:hypothetical protein
MQAVRHSVAGVLDELMQGPAAGAGRVLNPGDRGLLASLDMLPADAASARPGGRSSIAAHVDHLRYGIELLNRSASGDADPFATADYSASWRRQAVSEAEWRDRREALAREARAWRDTLLHSRDPGALELIDLLASVVHLAYHLGAIRQIDIAAAGPPATD